MRIPHGATDGQRMRLRGKGGPGAAGGPAGDLYLTIALRPHPRFAARATTCSIDVPLAPWEAALGAEVEIPTLDARVTLKIPPGSKSGQRLRLAGHGLPKPDGGAGDLYAVLSIAAAGDAFRARACALRAAARGVGLRSARAPRLVHTPIG